MTPTLMYKTFPQLIAEIKAPSSIEFISNVFTPLCVAVNNFVYI